MKIDRLVLAAALVLTACAPETQTNPTAVADVGSHPAWSRKSVIYEVNIRQYTPEGTFAAFQQHLPRLKDLGVDILWLMPVQPIGVENRKGGLGSYYSISDYTAINPEFGDSASFRALVDAAHGLGMKVILDWVANHTAFDHAWVTEHRDFYTSRADGTISYARNNDGTETDWTDVADLNYDNAALVPAMIAEMKWWLDAMNIDGFRCDVAWGVPATFWARASRELKAGHPDIFLLAEAEDPALHESFDMTYGWEFHHLLNELTKGEKPTSAIDEYLAREDSTYPEDAYRMYFTSNHDENSWQGTEFERMGDNNTPAFILSATMEKSMPLLYTGQEASLDRRLEFFEKDSIDWNGASRADFYRSVFELKHTQPALANGASGGQQKKLETDGGDRVYAFTRTQASNTVLVAVNFGDAPATVSYSGLAPAGGYTDWFDKSIIELAPTGTLPIPAHGYRVLVR
jgi:glycosidase